MKQMLCVVDFTEASMNALEVAARIANAVSAHLVVLFPYRLIDQEHSGDMTSLRRNLESRAKEKYLEWKEKLPEFTKASSEFLPEIGFMADRIGAHVRRDKIDMVVIGQELALSVNDIKHSALQTLIRNSQLPFVIVPAPVNAVASA